MIDTTIARDLAALGENSRLDIAPLPAAPYGDDAYRDDRPGAEARRNALADERRRELVLMPLALGQVFAHRVARIAAGGMAAAVALVVLAAIADHTSMEIAAEFVPGLRVTTVLLLSVLAVLASYVVATWFAERWFARRMRETVTSTGDTYLDLDHLARGPLDIARAAIRRLDPWAVGLVVAGTTSMVLVLGFATATAGLHVGRMFGGSLLDIGGRGELTSDVHVLTLLVICAGAAGWFVARGIARPGSLPARIVRHAGRWPVAVVAVAVAASAWFATTDLIASDSMDAPRDGVAMLWAGAIGTGIVWAVMFWRGREQARIGAD